MAAPLLLALIVLAPVFATEDDGGSSTVEQLSVLIRDETTVVYIKTSMPVPAFGCSVTPTEEREVVLEIPGAISELHNRYEFDSAEIASAAIDAGENGSAGVQIRFALKKEGALIRVEQIRDGLLLHFGVGGSPGSGGEDGRGGDYRVGVGDQLEVSVFGHDDMRTVADVRVDGTISYPLIGSLSVVGRTPAEIDAEISGALGREYLVDPQVTVILGASRSQWVTLFGEVRNPARYIIWSNMRLIDLIAAAGGLTKEAGTRLVINRTESGKSRQIVVARDDLLGGGLEEANPLLVHGDVVNVPENEVFYIRGQVNRPGSYLLTRNMTLLKAIAVAGGFGQFANRKQVELLRLGGEGVEKTLRINIKEIEKGKRADEPLEPDDTIIVPRRIF